MTNDTQQHTPGPWYCADLMHDGRSVVVIQSASINEDNYVGEVDVEDAQGEANARLIAAAPDLLDALEAIRARLDGEYDHPALVKYGALAGTMDDVRQLVRDAIDKVRGRD